jgi:hypothetical protein
MGNNIDFRYLISIIVNYKVVTEINHITVIFDDLTVSFPFSAKNGVLDFGEDHKDHEEERR